MKPYYSYLVKFYGDSLSFHRQLLQSIAMDDFSIQWIFNERITVIIQLLYQDFDFRPSEGGWWSNTFTDLVSFSTLAVNVTARCCT